MVDIQTVIERLEALRVYLAELDRYARYSFDELTSDFVKYRAAERSLQLTAQAIVDIATHIVTADYDTRVQDYRQAIESLGEERVLPPVFAERLAPIASFRNILVHEYLAIDPVKLYDILIHGRADIEEFGQRIAVYLQDAGDVDNEVSNE
ncbi:MAG: hypothetical protein B6I35_05565 [Anaerolineaceae bacterium 4572_32.2]|nr:MAG: hypothetical protein B6I35_05565 [Anaerolineaceae bacterium 4572_32.2]HEY72409.1 DUF86 domain-containing protein [Thermoflexia bacterium]